MLDGDKLSGEAAFEYIKKEYEEGKKLRDEKESEKTIREPRCT